MITNDIYHQKLVSEQELGKTRLLLFTEAGSASPLIMVLIFRVAI